MNTIISLLLAVSWAATDHKPSVAPDTALKWLMNGNNRFVKTQLRMKEGQKPADIKRLSSGQQPHAIVLSCSDSRVPPELVFDQKLGEIFVVRTAGEALGDNAVGSIEYAVEHLGSRLIVVMGHTSCGAVKAAHATLQKGTSAGSPALDGLVKDMHPRLAQYKGKEPTSPEMKEESWTNATAVARDLIRRSTILGGMWEKGELMIVPSLYDLQTGKVAFNEALKSEAGVRKPVSVPAEEKHEH